MAQKAAKQTARRNTQILNRTHLIAAAVNGLYLIVRALLFRGSFSRTSLLLYVLLSAPAFGIEIVFELNSRPVYTSNAPGADLKKSGQDLEAKGLTEWMWDVLYWTWGVTVFAAIIGDYAWYLYLVVPAYSAWLAWTTFGNVRQSLGMGGGATAAGNDGSSAQSTSKRQAKMEKRGGQKMVYR